MLTATLIVLAGPDIGKRGLVRDRMTLGSSPECDFVVLDPNVSMQHYRIDKHEGEWILVDIRSSTTAAPRGSTGSRFVLQSSDRIFLGRTILAFELQDPFELAYHESVELRASTDPLSGLPVYERFFTHLEWMLAVLAGRGNEIGVLLMDLDGIKMINDEHGHLAGAHVIATAGAIIGNVVGQRGIASRYGGDEFVSAIGGSRQDILRIAEEIRATIQTQALDIHGRMFSTSISIGVVFASTPGADAAALLDSADHALHEAKRLGKNRIVCASDDSRSRRWQKRKPMIMPLAIGPKGSDDGVLRDQSSRCMPMLAVMSGKHVGTWRHTISPLRIGRAPESEVVLTDEGIGLQHMTIEPRGKQWLVRACRDCTIHVDGARVHEQIVSHGARIWLNDKVAVSLKMQDAIAIQYHEQLQAMIELDGLTRLYRWERFHDLLAGMLDAARKQNRCLGLVVIDVDNQKSINDGYGHDTGSRFLQEIARRISLATAGKGIASRFGGDEFVIAVVDATETLVSREVERIRRAVVGHPFELDDVAILPALSVGVALFPRDGADAMSLFDAADRAMYKAKRSSKLLTHDVPGQP